ncbi:hypothetical protein E1262_01850 [Jiangella aurantiaca]|uniref:Heparinase II/III-like protein n=1 Tax=Jiangella aurantiaca TaxID=2530373 RepID=A0A4V2YT65_9ACTN|nr:hypothetical protein [Jiangella aurantiaca]TDD72627.1 hypothetical protein E1262_01850 [Jiangella aurantiaca]
MDDSWLITHARQTGDRYYDPGERLLRLPPNGNSVHTALDDMWVHPFRQSAAYALAVLESRTGGPAAEVLRRVARAQDADPTSPTYGVWSYVAEEPLAQMRRPDLNWADFIGHELLHVAVRHRDALPADVLDEVHGAIHRAATAIRRRDVHVAYTNIAAKGTFVTLAAGELLADDELLAYGRDRMERFFAEIDHRGIHEYNSPTYWLVTCAAMTAILRYVADARSRELACILHDRLWTHLVSRWHAATGQFGGPMSRAYASDLADNLPLHAYVAQATGYRAPFDALPDIGSRQPYHAIGLASAVVLRPEPPPAVVAALIGPGVIDERRELFETGAPDVVGTTWLGPAATLGSVSHADSWFQRRNLLCFWRSDDGPLWQNPVSYARLRVTKDDHDFVSGVFSSVQSGPHALWHVGLASPGGDRHVVRDEITGPTRLRSLRVSIEFGRLADPVVTVGGRVAGPSEGFTLDDEVAVRSGDVTVVLRFSGAEFGGRPAGSEPPRGRIRVDDAGRLLVDLDLLDAPEPVDVDLSRAGAVWAAGTVTVVEHVDDAATNAPTPRARLERLTDDCVRLTWTPGRRLDLRARTAVGTTQDHAATYQGLVDGVPITRERAEARG